MFAPLTLLVRLETATTLVALMGAGAADPILETTEQRIRAVHPAATIERTGPDGLLAQLAGELDLVEDLDRVLSRPILLDERTFDPGLRLGAALGAGPAALLDATAALVAARAAGRRIGRADRRHDERQARNRAIARALPAAIASGALHLVYQARVSLTDARVSGAEALLRWTDPVLGAVAPSEFMPIAVAVGLLADIGDHALQAAALQRRAWLEVDLDVPLSVNIAPEQLLPPGGEPASRRFAAVLARQDLRIQDIELEIPARAFDDPVLLEEIARLHRAGFVIAIDDFGAHAAPLARLGGCPADVLKLDRSFLEHMDVGPRQARLIGAVVELAGKMKMRVVAEGVERESQAQLLRMTGVRTGQGYLWHRPSSADDLVARIGS